LQDKGALATQAGLASDARIPLDALGSACRILVLIRECDAAHANVSLLNNEARSIRHPDCAAQLRFASVMLRLRSHSNCVPALRQLWSSRHVSAFFQRQFSNVPTIAAMAVHR